MGCSAIKGQGRLEALSAQTRPTRVGCLFAMGGEETTDVDPGAPTAVHPTIGSAVTRRHRQKSKRQAAPFSKGRPKANPANEWFAGHLARHQDDIYTFLYDPTIDATNWRGEQAIRPAVVNRKVRGGNRTEAGAEAQSILMSVLRTCAPQGRNVISFVSAWLRGERVRLDGIPAGP